jgi:hypothetical protein
VICLNVQGNKQFHKSTKERVNVTTVNERKKEKEKKG